jgi:hypothetical protein
MKTARRSLACGNAADSEASSSRTRRPCTRTEAGWCSPLPERCNSSPMRPLRPRSRSCPAGSWTARSARRSRAARSRRRRPFRASGRPLRLRHTHCSIACRGSAGPGEPQDRRRGTRVPRYPGACRGSRRGSGAAHRMQARLAREPHWAPRPGRCRGCRDWPCWWRCWPFFLWRWSVLRRASSSRRRDRG